MSPSIMVHSGPARMRVRSSTRTPASAPSADSLIWLTLLAAHGGRRIEVARAAVEIIGKLALVAHAEFLEVRFAPFEEGVHSLDRFLRAPHMRQEFHAVLPGGVEQVGFE